MGSLRGSSSWWNFIEAFLIVRESIRFFSHGFSGELEGRNIWWGFSYGDSINKVALPHRLSCPGSSRDRCPSVKHQAPPHKSPIPETTRISLLALDALATNSTTLCRQSASKNGDFLRESHYQPAWSSQELEAVGRKREPLICSSRQRVAGAFLLTDIPCLLVRGWYKRDSPEQSACRDPNSFSIPRSCQASLGQNNPPLFFIH